METPVSSLRSNAPETTPTSDSDGTKGDPSGGGGQHHHHHHPMTSSGSSNGGIPPHLHLNQHLQQGQGPSGNLSLHHFPMMQQLHHQHHQRGAGSPTASPISHASQSAMMAHFNGMSNPSMAGLKATGTMAGNIDGLYSTAASGPSPYSFAASSAAGPPGSGPATTAPNGILPPPPVQAQQHQQHLSGPSAAHYVSAHSFPTSSSTGSLGQHAQRLHHAPGASAQHSTHSSPHVHHLDSSPAAAVGTSSADPTMVSGPGAGPSTSIADQLVGSPYASHAAAYAGVNAHAINQTQQHQRTSSAGSYAALSHRSNDSLSTLSAVAALAPTGPGMVNGADAKARAAGTGKKAKGPYPAGGMLGKAPRAASATVAAGMSKSAVAMGKLAAKRDASLGDLSLLSHASSTTAGAGGSSGNRGYGRGAPPQAVPFVDKHSPFPLPPDAKVAGGVQEAIRKRLRGKEGKSGLDPTEEDPNFWDNLDGPIPENVRVALGKTRCYWTLLGRTGTDDLVTVFCDPILQQHLGSQVSSFIGTSFFDYVHPEELAKCRSSFREIVQGRKLGGDAVRVRFCRVPEIRRRLGCDNPQIADNAAAYVFDENYLTIEVVINWISEGLVLAFYHAIIDLSPEDNNEEKKTSWTNWCGMPPDAFRLKECDTVWQQVKKHVKPALVRPGFCPDRIFQILRSGQTGDILFSWPPPRLFPRMPNDASALEQASTASYADGSYFADDFAKLAHKLALKSDPKAGQHARTSCQRRFGSEHELNTEGVHRRIRSIIIPYGDLLLACFEVVSQVEGNPFATARGATEDATAAAQLLLGTAEHAAQQRQQQQQAAPSTAGVNGHQQLPSSRGSVSGAWDTSFGSNGSGPLDSLADASLTFELMTEDEKRAKLGGLRASDMGNDSADSSSANVFTLAAAAVQAAEEENKTCTSCGTTNSPEWRKGPSGKKTLCNACGLRFARQTARQRRKDEAAAAAAANGLPPPTGKRGKGGADGGKKKKKKGQAMSPVPSSGAAAMTPAKTSVLSPPPAQAPAHTQDIDPSSFHAGASLSHHDFSQHAANAIELGMRPYGMYRTNSGGAGSAHGGASGSAYGYHAAQAYNQSPQAQNAYTYAGQPGIPPYYSYQ